MTASYFDRSLPIAKLALSLGLVNRATRHENGTAESDTTHTVMLALIAVELAPAELDRGLIAQMALVHDLVEAYAGDVDTSTGLTKSEAQAKAAREEKSMHRILSENVRSEWLGPMLMRYERQACPESRWVRIVDKAMPKLVHGLSRMRFTKQQTFDELELSHADQLIKMKREYGYDGLQPVPPVHVRVAFDFLIEAMCYAERVWADTEAAGGE